MNPAAAGFCRFLPPHAGCTVSRPPLTAAQRAVLAYLLSYFAEHQRFPSMREIAAHFGWANQSGPVCHLTALQRKGYLTRPTGPVTARAYEVAGLSAAIAAAVRAHADQLLAEEQCP